MNNYRLDWSNTLINLKFKFDKCHLPNFILSSINNNISLYFTLRKKKFITNYAYNLNKI